MAFYNALRADKRACFFQNSRHGYVAPEPFQRFYLEGDAVKASAQASGRESKSGYL